MRIGIFDSGVGGITVLHEAIRLIPDEDYLYYADTANVPYGIKSKEEVKHCILEAVDFISGQGVKALVIACNTATSIAVNDLRKQYSFPILGMEPAVKPAVENSRNKRILVVATPLTLKEQKYHSLVEKIDINNIVDALPLPELVEYAEGFVFDEAIILQYLRDKLSEYNIRQYGTVVLGCTHFAFYRNVFRKLFRNGTDIIDGNIGTVKHLKYVLENRKLLGGCGTSNVVFYSSNNTTGDNSRYKRYLDLLDKAY